MVCPRCIRVVTDTLRSLGLHLSGVELGVAVVEESIDDALHLRIAQALRAEGFELLENPRTQLAEALKGAIIERVHYQKDAPHILLSDYLSQRFHRDYSMLSKLFSEETGTTIEKYAIAQKIERAKELLTYGELTLNEIADLLDYSSTSHLSAQFKQVTGMSPTAYKKAANQERKPLDAL